MWLLRAGCRRWLWCRDWVEGCGVYQGEGLMGGWCGDCWQSLLMEALRTCLFQLCVWWKLMKVVGELSWRIWWGTMSWRTGHPLIQTPCPVPWVSLDHVAGVCHEPRDVPPPICHIHSSGDVKQTCRMVIYHPCGPGLHIQDQGHLGRTVEHPYAMTEASKNVFQLR
jgi:hypothetical protein